MAHRARLVSIAAALAGVALLAGSASAAGLLLPKDGSIPPLALKHHRVNIDVRDGTAVTTIEQVYLNSTPRMLEATYLFPVPDDAVVMDFRLMINGKMQKGEVLEKDRANQIYGDIVRRMRDPGIVDWIGKNLFQARIFPIPANGEQKITIQYTQVLPFLDGTYKLSYPLKTTQGAAQTLEDLTLTARIASHVPIKTVYSPSHKISVSRPNENEAVIGFEGDKVVLDRDFSMYFGVSKKDVGLNLITYRPDPKEPGYFLMMAAPKAVFDTDEIQGKAITFVLDTSGSMTGVKLEQAKKALAWCLDHLGDDDRFNVIRFSSDVETFEKSLVAASKANVEAAKRFVDGFDAAGGTAIDDALSAALGADVGQETHLVLFLTDGRPTVGETEPKAILERAAKANGKKARVFALGIGDDINTHLLDALADNNGGTSAYVKPGEDMDAQIAALYNQIAFPVLTDIDLDINKIKTFAVLPSKLPDIFRGGQLMIIGRYRGAGDALIRLTGTMTGKARRFDFEETFPAERSENEFVASLWAHRQVGFLLDQIRLNGETAELKAEVVQLAKKYGIVTPYTSYLVVEDGALTTPRPVRPIDPMPEPRPRPVVVPRHTKAAEERAPAAGFSYDDDEAEAAAVRSATAKKDAYGASSGAGAVDAAKAVRRLKEKDRAGTEVSAVRRVSGRVFSFRAGRGWVDNDATGAEDIVIAPYSLAWMTLAAELPSLKDALALGDQVTLKIGKLTVVVRAGGETKLDAKTLARIKAAAK
ncbi:MAG: VWA domain-containing protein [Deltaproteobacteria bacterium]|nr:MAG: VWA domain-containing protein [Deltaproteobacteria bacterium]